MKMLRSEIADGMRIDWDVEIPVSDGSILRADVFRPVAEGRYPVLMSHGPYAKALHFEDGFPGPWRALFEPLGIRQAVWERDAAGTFVASSYLYMSARDLARVGLLMQREGRWHDQQLLPRAWVEFCRTPFAGYRAGQDVAVAGGHWWLNRIVDGAPRPWPDAPEDTYAALGHWGQALYIVPQQRLVIVRYGDDRDGSYQHNELLKRVLAAFPTPEQP